MQGMYFPLDFCCCFQPHASHSIWDRSGQDKIFLLVMLLQGVSNSFKNAIEMALLEGYYPLPFELRKHGHTPNIFGVLPH